MGERVSLQSQKELLLYSIKSKGQATILISGKSMYPTLITGQLIRVRPKKCYEIGDIVAFYRDNGIKIIVHRIVNKTKEGYVTKGDNFDYEDWPIKAEDIIGVVTEIIK